ncbi:MAG: hypothetical protein HQ521_17865 [Bacteroidetes bacterium]|nr:hypothetical protein [Bacteroidota bacterium]
MKTLLKIVGVLVVIIIALLFILPLVFKSEIIRLTKKELNKNINATVNFEDIDLSLIKSFPDFNLSIEGLYIVGDDDFNQDTLIKVKTISMALDIFSVLNSDNYVVKRINLIDPSFNVIVNRNGKANYDISLPDDVDSSSKPSTEETSTFSMSIKKFQISNGKVNYIDQELNTQVFISGLNHTLSGELGSENFVLHTSTKIESISLIYDGISYLTKATLAYNANITADTKNEIYTLGKNELIINNLFIAFDGSVSFINDDPNMVITFASKGNKFKDILSMIPAIYTTGYEKITTDGTFSVNGYVKGIYTDEQLPSFDITAEVKDGMFSYPDLPKSVTNINIKSNIANKGGIADNTIINVSEFRMQLGDNPISASFKISSPVSDPNIKARITGDFNLAETKDFYPISETDDLHGELIIDVKFDGKLSAVENIGTKSAKGEQEFLAMGSVVAKDISYRTSMFVNPLIIKTTQINFSPYYLDIVTFSATSGKSDIGVTGKIENYLDYYLNNGVLNGTMVSNSNYLNIDEMFIESKDDEVTGNDSLAIGGISTGETEAGSVIDIPDNINFAVSSKFDKLIYDKLEMDNVGGKLIIANKTLQINNLKMEAVGGNMTINGSYSTIDVENPKVDFDLKMENMNIPSAYDQFAIFRNYLPLTKKTTGLFSADFNLNTLLKNDMMPDYSTMSGGGLLSTKKIVISGLNSLTEIADMLNIEQLKQLSIDDFIAHFKLEAGKLIVKPTKFNYKNIDAEIAGWTGLDQSIEYDMNIMVPRSEFGSSANKVIDDLLSQANFLGNNFSLPSIIPINISIEGTLDKPVVKTKLSDNIGSTSTNIVKEIIKNELGNETAAKAQKIIDDASKQAKYIIDEAKKQSKLIKDNAADAVELLNKETAKQAEGLIAEGKKNGMVAEMAAKEAAKRIRKEAANNGVGIINEANRKADGLIIEAEKLAEKLKRDAQAQADNIKK